MTKFLLVPCASYGQVAFRGTTALGDALGDAPPRPVPPAKLVASCGGQWISRDLRVPGVSKCHGGVRVNEDTRL